MHIPIIRLEIEGMKYTMVTVLQEHAAKMDADILAAVERYCTPENLTSVVDQAATKALAAAISEEVGAFFRWGNGRKAVKAAVGSLLSSREPMT